MKRLKDFLFATWLLLFFLFLVFIGNDFYCTKKEETAVHKIAVENTSKEEIFFEREGVEHPFVLDGDIKDSIVFYAASYYYALPEAMRTEFSENGWQVVLTEKDISKEYYHGPVKGRLAGLADSTEKRLYVHSKRNDIRRALHHEFGHFLDFNAGMISINSGFEEIYEQEKDLFKEKGKIDNHCTSNAQEYFAEAFSQMILYPNHLKENCPKTYDFIKEVFIKM